MLFSFDDCWHRDCFICTEQTNSNGDTADINYYGLYDLNSWCRSIVPIGTCIYINNLLDFDLFWVVVTGLVVGQVIGISTECLLA